MSRLVPWAFAGPSLCSDPAPRARATPAAPSTPQSCPRPGKGGLPEGRVPVLRLSLRMAAKTAQHSCREVAARSLRVECWFSGQGISLRACSTLRWGFSALIRALRLGTHQWFCGERSCVGLGPEPRVGERPGLCVLTVHEGTGQKCCGAQLASPWKLEGGGSASSGPQLPPAVVELTSGGRPQDPRLHVRGGAASRSSLATLVESTRVEHQSGETIQSRTF